MHPDRMGCGGFSKFSGRGLSELKEGYIPVVLLGDGLGFHPAFLCSLDGVFWSLERGLFMRF